MKNKTKQEITIQNTKTINYGFRIGKKIVDIENEISEQNALLKLVKNYWHLINDVGDIQLIGAPYDNN